MSHDHDHGSTHGHDHGISENADGRYLASALALLVAYMVAEVIVAFLSHSLALLSDAGHMLTDAGAIAVAIWAMRLAARPAKGSWTFGWKRAEILSALGNGVTMLVIAAVVAVEAIRRLIEGGGNVNGTAVLVTAIVGVAVNVAAAWLLARANRSSLNVEGAYQHILTDLYGFIGTIVAAIVILTTGWAKADAVASLVVVVLMLKASWGLLRDSGRVLLEAAPAHIDMDAIRQHLLEVEHVTDVHDLHVWTVTSKMPSLSAHLVIQDTCFNDGHAAEILAQVHQCLDGHFEVDHSTFQLEPESHSQHEHTVHA
jgi:cobalt-zinc-cadmium efflux system protein